MYIHIQVHTIACRTFSYFVFLHDSCTLALNPQAPTKVVRLLAHQPLYTEATLTLHDLMFHIQYIYTYASVTISVKTGHVRTW